MRDAGYLVRWNLLHRIVSVSEMGKNLAGAAVIVPDDGSGEPV